MIGAVNRPLNVLLAEDDPAHAAAIRRTLLDADAQIQVRVAGTLAAFRQAVAESQPDIAIMDLNLPDGNAIEILTAPPDNDPFPVVVMTSYGNEQVAVEMLRAGALDYVEKSPQAFAGMPHIVERALRNWNLLQERKRAESQREAALEALRDSLAGKEVLLKEVHHRVKNNLTAIIGLLQLQRQTVTDPAAVALFRELERRIRSMALVHDKLYHFESLDRIDLQDYIEKLITELRAALAPHGNVCFSVAAAGVVMGLDSAVPCGLILNELITNALKYAFPGDQPRAGEKACAITVAAELDGAGDDGVYTLTVADNGVGLPADLDWATTKTLGLRLIRMLGQYQLKGQIELDRANGTSFRLVFASRQREKR